MYTNKKWLFLCYQKVLRKKKETFLSIIRRNLRKSPWNKHFFLKQYIWSVRLAADLLVYLI